MLNSYIFQLFKNLLQKKFKTKKNNGLFYNQNFFLNNTFWKNYNLFNPYFLKWYFFSQFIGFYKKYNIFNVFVFLTHTFKFVKNLPIKMSILLPKHFEFLNYRFKEYFILSKVSLFKWRLICNFFKKKFYVYQKGICVFCKLILIKKNEYFNFFYFNNLNLLMLYEIKFKIKYKFLIDFNNFILIHKLCYNKIIRSNFLFYLKKPIAKKLAF